MDFGGHEEEIRMPMPVSYDIIHESSRIKMLTAVSNGGRGGGGGEEVRLSGGAAEAKKGVVKYRECLKNHAANIGGHAVDGCGDFMASGEEGTLEALKCAACCYHRNFHRREVEGEPSCYICKDSVRKNRSAFMPLSAHAPLALPLPSHLAALPSPCEDHDHMNSAAMNAVGGGASMKKRSRTKFTHEQKERMLVFAEKLGWRIQKHDEGAVQQFCHEAGIKRHVLKVDAQQQKHPRKKSLACRIQQSRFVKWKGSLSDAEFEAGQLLI